MKNGMLPLGILLEIVTTAASVQPYTSKYLNIYDKDIKTIIWRQQYSSSITFKGLV